MRYARLLDWGAHLGIVVLVAITPEYFLFASLAPGAVLGRARFALRLAGLVVLASSLAAGAPAAGVAALAEEPLEALQDRLADLAGRLPPSPALPAMALAESLASGSSRGGPGATDALAVLWALTHLNGRTFDRNGLPILAPDLAAGGAWDFFAP